MNVMNVMKMTPAVAGMMICALRTAPLGAQERSIFSNVTFRASEVRDAPAAARQAPGPAPAAQAGRPGLERAIFAISVGASVGGTVWVVRNTREALDRGLEVRTFPLVWFKTSDRNDKGKVTAIVAISDGAVIALSALAFKHHNAKTASLLNFFVAGLTTGIAIHERSVINKQK